MTKDDTTRMAHEAAGFDGTTSLERPVVLYAALSKDFLDKFAALVAAAEREACAKVCDRIEEEAYVTYRKNYDAYAEGLAAGALACFEAIRARGEK